MKSWAQATREAATISSDVASGVVKAILSLIVPSKEDYLEEQFQFADELNQAEA